MPEVTQIKHVEQHALTRQSLSRFLLFSMVVLAFFTILNFSLGLQLLALVQALVLLTLPAIYSWLKKGAPHGIIKHVIGFDALVIFLPLIFVPTAENTGIYWIFGYPMVVFFFLGTRTGFVWTGIYLFLLLVGIALSSTGVLTLYYSPLQTSLGLVEVVVFTAIGYFFTSDREKAEQRHLLHLRHLECIDKFEHELRSDIPFDTAIDSALRSILNSVDSHRAWLIHPVDINSHAYKVAYEQTSSEFPGAKELGVDIPSTDGVREMFKHLLSSGGPVHYHKGNPSPLTKSLEESFSLHTQLMTVLRPTDDDPWLLGLHYCKDDKTYTTDELRLFQDIANRLEGKLTQLLLHLELKSSEKNLRDAIIKAEAASHAKSEFLSVMSHELRTPLHGIIGLQGLIANDADKLNEEQCENLMLAQQSAKSLRALVNDVLDIAKIESGNMVLVKDEFSLFSCIRDAFVPFIHSAREKEITLSLKLVNIPEKLIGDESRLRQVLLNLIGNAIKFTHEGEISMHASCIHGHLHFKIQDSGIGIPAEKIESIFEPFTQLENSSLTQQKGTGLGTSIVKRFVELMDGNVQVESALGKGSCFSFQIPCNPVGRERISHSIDATKGDLNIIDLKDIQEPTVKRTLHIKALLAEDDPIGLRIAIKQLSKAGIEVDAVDNGNSAWEMVQNNSYDLLLTDIRMPGLNGIELTQKIRKMEKESNTPYLPIIGLSAHAMDEVARECFEAGMNHFMTKPVDPESILKTITKNIPDKTES
ncbi:MAG: ATP-binding protein [Mariprofundaceae bacterium]